jgi:GNAT superfamily N-acetyltransferase
MVERPSRTRLGVEVRKDPAKDLAAYARVSIAFEVRSVFDVEETGDARRFRLVERGLPEPYVKDYDAVPGASPAELAARFDLTNWAVFAARSDGVRVGGAIVAFDTEGVELLEGRRDLAVLWDLRVAPAMRGRGVGAALFRAGEAWAGARGCRHLKVETQDVNVPACRFYARQGCALGAVRRGAYEAFPSEVQLLWWKDLTTALGMGETVGVVR